MALVLDATVGGAAANSYSTRAEADSYHESRLYSTSWSGATDATKDAALVWATRLHDSSIEWKGAVRTHEQALRWPRYYAFSRDDELIQSDIVPEEVKHATAELARLLI
jgi:hypothetical protein